MMKKFQLMLLDPKESFNFCCNDERGGVVQAPNNLIDLDVDGAFCISIKDRADKRALLEEAWAKLSLQPEYVLVDKDTENPERGCFNSHQTCMRLALERDYKRVLIFEDDVTIQDPREGQIKNINRYINSHNPELFFLGVILGKAWLTWSKNIVRCRGQGTQGYIMSAQGCEKILKYEYDGIGIDTLFRYAFKKRYSTYPMLCHQRPEDEVASDIAKYRKSYGMDKGFWEDQRRKEKLEIIRNWYKTAFHIF